MTTWRDAGARLPADDIRRPLAVSPTYSTNSSDKSHYLVLASASPWTRFLTEMSVNVFKFYIVSYAISSASGIPFLPIGCYLSQLRVMMLDMWLLLTSIDIGSLCGILRHNTAESLFAFHSNVIRSIRESFYRATLCVSAAIAVARCRSDRLSVRHVGVLYQHGWRYRQTSFSAR